MATSRTSPGDTSTAGRSRASRRSTWPGRQGGVVRRRHRSQLRQCRRFDRDQAFTCAVGEGPRQPPDGRLPEAGRARSIAAATSGDSMTSRSSASRNGPRGWTSALLRRGDNAIEIRTRERLRLGDWYHVAVTYDGSGKAAGLTTVRERRAARPRGCSAIRFAVRSRLTRRCDLAARRSVSRSSVRWTTCACTAAHCRRSRSRSSRSTIRSRVILSGVIGKPSKEEAERDARLFPHLRGAGSRCGRPTPNSRRCVCAKRISSRSSPPPW